jgi:hypothetical protein
MILPLILLLLTLPLLSLVKISVNGKTQTIRQHIGTANRRRQFKKEDRHETFSSLNPPDVFLGEWYLPREAIPCASTKSNDSGGRAVRQAETNEKEKKNKHKNKQSQ